jgi:hypothetical protein
MLHAQLAPSFLFLCVMLSYALLHGVCRAMYRATTDSVGDRDRGFIVHMDQCCERRAGYADPPRKVPRRTLRIEARSGAYPFARAQGVVSAGQDPVDVDGAIQKDCEARGGMFTAYKINTNAANYYTAGIGAYGRLHALPAAVERRISQRLLE